ncbi:hypothetical protein [Microbulbifer thermotolerans]|uniref:Uncharacterized protein n=1 Tax=Microbulbifer thermotolerans TaxID=252514 RepID=A0AB35HYW6_MICTH|nr:hypothetical protein [Microbulbifer thermotolerans]MCX2780404.1 hypothetical protein [Microbulbifer thermotolerans]MCX2802238.1 hypothetical protein [Microbulbifer thermotolerans]MCX2805924.1 hypothetical protein [Microbulbifer thermotolerans]
MPAKQTSKSTYQWIKNNGLASPMRERVFRALVDLGEATRREIEEAAGLRPNQVCGRVNELLACDAIYVRRVDRCKTTGRVVEVLKPNSRIARRYLKIKK